jgi:hypothetical protein
MDSVLEIQVVDGGRQGGHDRADLRLPDDDPPGVIAVCRVVDGGLNGRERDQVLEIRPAAGPDMEPAGGFLDDGIESVLGSEPHGFLGNLGFEMRNVE